mgnify:CR=1 FL=1
MCETSLGGRQGAADQLRPTSRQPHRNSTLPRVPSVGTIQLANRISEQRCKPLLKPVRASRPVTDARHRVVSLAALRVAVASAFAFIFFLFGSLAVFSKIYRRRKASASALLAAPPAARR